MRSPILLTNIFLVLAAGPLKAAPSAFANKFGALNIVNDTSSTIIRDHESSNLIWVLPPSSGKKAFYSSLQPSMNANLCDGLNSLTLASVEMSKRVKKLAESFDEIRPEIEAAESDVKNAKLVVAELSTNIELSQLIKIEDQIMELKQRREELLSKLSTCEGETCIEVNQDYKSVRDLLNEKEKFIYDISKENLKLSKQYKRAKSKLEAFEQILNDLYVKQQKFLTQIADIESAIMGLYASKAKLEGAYVSVDFDTGWDANVASLAKRYRNYEFRPVQTRNARIFANLVAAGDEKSYYASLPAVLDYSIAGQEYLPAGEIPVDQNNHALPSKITGTLRLSMIGACPLLLKNASGGQMQNAFTISASYEHPMLYTYDLQASYNLYKLYEVIKSSGTKHGFFSSSSYRNLVKSGNQEGVMTISISNQDGRYTTEQETEIIRDAKKQLVDRVLSAMAEPVKANPTDEPLKLGPAPEAGAVVIADGLSKVCGFHIYCSAGSWILRGVYGVFGGSSVEDKFRENFNYEEKEEWNIETVKFIPATTSF